MEFNFKKIELKWQKKWEEKKIFQVKESKKKKKYFVTFPYPYVNLSPHIGHFYTIMRVDAFARYKRSKGYNVLFPQAWHCTGSPIVASAQRVKEGEPKIIEQLKKEGFSQEEIKQFSEPEHWIKIFSKRWFSNLSAMGMSIDWRRNFITTSLNPYYDKFVRWQFGKLKEKGYIAKGEHPVVWDPKTNMPVGDHDRIKGEGEIPQEMILFKFKLDDGRNIITTTLRHDTIMGITNVYVNPNIEYTEIEVNGERWILGEPAIEKLRNQNYRIKIKSRIKGKDLIGKKVKSFGNREILVLPATFLDINYGTGIVHSVPSESADDLIALRDLQKDEKLMKKYKLNIKEVRAINPIEIFNTPGIKGNAAQYYLEKYNIKSQNEREKLEKIRKELYTFTFTKSTFNKLYSKGFSKNLGGMSISKGQEIIKKDLLKEGVIDIFYELTGEVVSRSLTPCVVKIVSDQWFIKYGDKKWKKEVHKALKATKLYPENVRAQFNYVVDWLNDWACTREYGLGTKLPFDEKWLIESLSDSTIYMAYYTIVHLIRKLNIKAINDELFDYVFLNRGKGKKEWRKLKDEFEYWYPLDFRNSGKDLVQNHLTFFLFNHVAIFPRKYWPKSIGVNGWVRVDNQKMSKSLGNIIPLKEMYEKFGADASRLTILNGGEGLDDPNWDSRFAENLNRKFESITTLIRNYGKGQNKMDKIDEWIKNKLSLHVNEATEFMEETLFRSAIQKIFFDLISDVKWYLKRTDKPNKKILQKIIESLIIMMQPFTPHLSEELWSKIGKKSFVSLEKWPSFKLNKFEDTEKSIKNLMGDINNLLSLVKKKPTKAFIYVIPKEIDLYKESKDFLSKELNLKVVVFANNEKIYDPMNKASKTKFGKPAIYLE